MRKYSKYAPAMVVWWFICLPIFSQAQNQLDEGRTTATKIADLLNRFPTPDHASYENAMQAMANLGIDGLGQMASMLKTGTDDEKLEYALGGFAFYASHPDRDQMARMAVQGYGKALDKLSDEEAKDFLITQFKWIGKEDATPYLEAFLHDPRLSGSASRVLATIGSESAERALILALNASDNLDLKLNFIEALGDFSGPNAVNEVSPYLSSPNPAIKKVTIYALSNIADPSSAKELRKEAERADFTYERTNATAMYLQYIENIGEKENPKLALRLLEWLDKKTNLDDHFQTKSGILRLQAKFNPEKAHDILLEAATSDEKQYRGAALGYLTDKEIVDNLPKWQNTLGNATAEAKAAIIRRLGKIKNSEVAQLIKPYLKSDNQEIRMAAIKAVASSGDNLALQDLLEGLEKAGDEETQLLTRTLKSLPGDQVTQAAAAMFSSSSDQSKLALLEILASRAAESQISVAFNAVNDPNEQVKTTALSSLSAMATPNDLDRLVSLLKEQKEEKVLLQIQDAIITANAQKNNLTNQTQWALGLLPQLSPEKQVYLYKVLATTGGEVALQNLTEIYESGSPAQKMEVVNALNQSEDQKAAAVLLHIARSTDNPAEKEAALDGYIRLIAASTATNEAKVIMLRNALDLTTTAATINTILGHLGRYPTFQSLLVAKQYLDDPAFQQAASRAVMNIVLNNDEIMGDLAMEAVQKTKEVISGQDSQYYKTSLQKYLDELVEGPGFYALFNGMDLEGWKGVFSNPIERAGMSDRDFSREQEKANEEMARGWKAEDGQLIFTGEGHNIATNKDFGDFEMYVDWKITEDGDAGIYLRGTPQVQIWDTARTDVGAEVGSGGLYNNQKYQSTPLAVADNPIGEWNTFYIKMQGENVTVYLNGILVADEVPLENYWDRDQPIFPTGQIELQAHGTNVAYRDIYIKELTGAPKFELSEEEAAEDFTVLFDGNNLDHWQGNKTDYVVENGVLTIYPDRGGQGNLMTMEEYGDFVFRFEFKLTPGANNGLGIRAPLEGDAAYAGMELQILDNTAEIYNELKPYQYHGSLYGVAAAEKGHLNPVGDWNYQEVTVQGNQIKVTLNGEKILDVDISEAKEKGTLDGREHPGLFREEGHIGFLGHGDVVYFRNIRIKRL